MRDIARPLVNILKQVPMDGLQVGEIKVASRRGFGEALRHKSPFDRIQFALVTDVVAVAKDLVVGRIAVGGVAHSAAGTPTRSRTRF